MKQTDVVVICAGVKSVWTSAVLWSIWKREAFRDPLRQHDFPAFYSRRSGFPAECRMDSPAEIAQLIRAKTDMGLKGGMLVACPIPAEYEIDYEIMDQTIQKALQECKEKGITGKRITPFLLDRIKELTEDAA